MLPDFTFNRDLRRYAERTFAKYYDEIRCIDLRSTIELGDVWDMRPYVGEVGIFTEDMLTIDIPYLTWYCRSDGNIWAEWRCRLTEKHPLYKRAMKRLEGPLSFNNGVLYTSVSMSKDYKYKVNKLTHEHWTMHKLASDTLL